MFYWVAAMSFLPRRALVIAGLLIAILPSTPVFAQKCLHPDFRVELLGQPPEIEHPSVVTCDDNGTLYIGDQLVPGAKEALNFWGNRIEVKNLEIYNAESAWK